MAQYYLVNDNFVNDLFDKILSSRQEAVDTYSKDLRQEMFLYLVLVAQFEGVFTKKILNTLISATLEATLEREENNFNNFGIAFEPPETEFKIQQYIFHKPIEFNSNNLKKLAPAIDSTKYYIGVWVDENNKLIIWGFKGKIMEFLTVNSISAGKISLNCISDLEQSFKCFISHTQISYSNPFSNQDNPLKKSLFTQNDITSLFKLNDCYNLLAKMFANGFGGILLFVKSDVEKWKDSIGKPILYLNSSEIGYEYTPISEKYNFFQKIQQNSHQNKSFKSNEDKKIFRAEMELGTEKAKASFDDLYNLTKVDGATILTNEFKVIAFGAKIETSPIQELIMISIIEAFSKKEHQLPIAKIGGMRHQSAAKFIYNQRECLAIVVSEDRKISVFSWNQEKQLVEQLKNFEINIF